MDQPASPKPQTGAIIVRLLGGLGNQMFQYALGRRLSLLHQRPLKLDVSFYQSEAAKSKWAVRSFGLENFNIQAEAATEQEIKPFKKYLDLSLKGRVFRRLNSYGSYYSRSYILEPKGKNFVFDRRLIKTPLKAVVYLDGFWQSEKYFLPIEQTIRQDFAFKQDPDAENKAMLDIIAGCNSVAIHIRHGDNATKMAARHGVLPIAYYEKAVAEIVKQVSHPKVYVFSDDQKWARQNLKLNFPMVFVAHNGEEKHHEDLRLMSHCKHHIIGNSTFSWWGAWLGKKPGQLVYAPSRYHMAAHTATSDYYPQGWKLVTI